MEPRVSMITLGVDDLARSRAFYADLGWTGPEVEETVFVQIGALVLALWDRHRLAAECGVASGADGFGSIALAHNVHDRADVDAIVAVARAAGATITRTPAETFYGGYTGCFTDPDGHVWEIAHNPGFPLADDGAVTLPDFGDAAT